MGVVDHHGCPELLGRGNDSGQRGDVTVHAEDAVGHDQDQSMRAAAVSPAVGSRSRQGVAQGGYIGVRIDHPRGLGQAHPIDDRSVVQAVADDQVGLACDCGNDPGVRAESGWEAEDGRGSFESGEGRLELLVERHRPGDRPDGAGPDAKRLDGGQRRGPHAGVVREAQVVVGAEADTGPTVDDDLRTLCRAHHPERAIEVPGAQVGELVGNESKRVGPGHGGHVRPPAAGARLCRRGRRRGARTPGCTHAAGSGG